MLTDEEIDKLAGETYGPTEAELVAFVRRDFARAIESAILAKLREQSEPVLCVAADDLERLRKKGEGDAHIKAWLPPAHEKTEIALYTHPQPLPEGMVMVPREPTQAMIKAGYSAGMYSTPDCIRAYRAMIAAAEKDVKA